MSHYTNSAKKKEGGFSLLELLLVVAVGAVLILAGLAAYRLVTGNNNVNEGLRLLNTLKHQTQKSFQAEGTYGGGGADLVPTLINLRALPSGSFNAATGNTRTPFGAPFTIVSNAVNQFDIGFTGIPQGACVALAQAYDTNTDSDYVGVDINAGGINADDADGSGFIESDEALGTCAGNANTLTWTFF